MDETSTPYPPGRLLAIGDIHGCRRPLQQLLEQVRPTADDRLVFLGDYVDRGPDSAGVVADLLELRQRLPRTVFLRGNHEQMLLDALDDGEPAPFLHNGGTRTIASYQAVGGWPPPAAHRDFFAALPYSFACGDYLFVHAGLRPQRPITAQCPEDLLWIRRDFLDADDQWGKIVVFGHTPHAQVLFTPGRIGLDTGCVYGGRLTCCEVRSRRLWQSDRCAP